MAASVGPTQSEMDQQQYYDAFGQRRGLSICTNMMMMMMMMMMKTIKKADNTAGSGDKERFPSTKYRVL